MVERHARKRDDVHGARHACSRQTDAGRLFGLDYSFGFGNPCTPPVVTSDKEGVVMEWNGWMDLITESLQSDVIN